MEQIIRIFLEISVISVISRWKTLYERRMELIKQKYGIEDAYKNK